MSVQDFLQLHESAPQRPVTWRWDLAGALTSPTEAADYDDWVRVAHEIQAENRSGQPAPVVARAIVSKGRAVADAYAFWMNGRTSASINPPKPDDFTPMYGPLSPAALAAAELEALVLAGKSPERIARRTGLSAAAVLWYERLWFDVRDRLRHPSWVAHKVIGTIHQGNLGTLLPAMIRAYGYYTRSTRIVALLAGGFDATAARNAARSPETFFAADAMAAGSLKAALAIRLMPLNDRRTYARVVELHQEATRIASDASALAGTEDENKLRTAVETLVGQVKFRYGKAPPLEPPLRLTTHQEDVG